MEASARSGRMCHTVIFLNNFPLPVKITLIVVKFVHVSPRPYKIADKNQVMFIPIIPVRCCKEIFKLIR